MPRKNDKKNSLDKKETLFEEEKRLRLEAIESAKKHVDIKPIKYLLK
jgi:hypothetical protein